jgi:hypothetical protein
VSDPNCSKLCIRDRLWLANDPEASFANMYFELSVAIELQRLLHLAVEASLKTNSPIPDRAAVRVIEAWNVPDFKYRA